MTTSRPATVGSGIAPRVTARAPGRINLIGEHTDYNDGLVLPMPIPQQTTVHLTPREDRRVQLSSHEQGGTSIGYALGEEKRTGTWVDYVQGVTQVLSIHGYQVRGFDATIESTVPMGAGLSSSAALQVATLRALRTAFSLDIDDLKIASLARIAEVEFVGVPVGMMDQMVVSLGRQGCALFIDTRTQVVEEVQLPESIEVVVISSGITHAHGSGQYRERRDECVRAARTLDLLSLRDLTLKDLARLSTIDPLLARRASHVFTENQRVVWTKQALERGDVQQLGALFAASHASMRDDFEISIPEVDLLVELGHLHSYVHAARLSGGGFGGSVVMLAQRGRGLIAAREISASYSQRSGCKGAILLPATEDDNHGA